MALPASFANELRRALGSEHVITEPEQLRVYECDGLTGHRAVPELVVLPGSTEEVQAVVRACSREARSVRRARRRDRALRRRDSVAGGVVVSLARMNRILEIDLDSQRVVVEPGVANLDVTRAVAAARLLLRARPLEPAGLHDRRQRRRELRRRALPQARLHRPPRHRAHARAAGRRGRRARRRRRSTRTAPTCSGVVVGSEGTLGIVTQDHAAGRPRAGGGADAARRLRDDRRGRRGGVRDRRRGDPALARSR